MKTEILTKDGLEIYTEEIKNYIDNNCSGSNNTINSDTEPTTQSNNDYWIQEY